MNQSTVQDITSTQFTPFGGHLWAYTKAVLWHNFFIACPPIRPPPIPFSPFTLFPLFSFLHFVSFVSTMKECCRSHAYTYRIRGEGGRGLHWGPYSPATTIRRWRWRQSMISARREKRDAGCDIIRAYVVTEETVCPFQGLCVTSLTPINPPPSTLHPHLKHVCLI